MKTLILDIIAAYLITYLVFVNTDLIPYNATTAALVFLFVYALLWLSSAAYNTSYFSKIPKAVSFLAFFLKEVFIANLRIAYDIITPHYHMQPTVIALPLDVKTDIEITLLACMITLTPGSLSLDLSEDKKVLYIHALYVGKGGTAELKNNIKNGFERRLMELTA